MLYTKKRQNVNLHAIQDDIEEQVLNLRSRMKTLDDMQKTAAGTDNKLYHQLVDKERNDVVETINLLSTKAGLSLPDLYARLDTGILKQNVYDAQDKAKTRQAKGEGSENLFDVVDENAVMLHKGVNKQDLEVESHPLYKAYKQYKRKKEGYGHIDEHPDLTQQEIDALHLRHLWDEDEEGLARSIREAKQHKLEEMMNRQEGRDLQREEALKLDIQRSMQPGGHKYFVPHHVYFSQDGVPQNIRNLTLLEGEEGQRAKEVAREYQRRRHIAEEQKKHEEAKHQRRNMQKAVLKALGLHRDVNKDKDQARMSNAVKEALQEERHKREVQQLQMEQAEKEAQLVDQPPQHHQIMQQQHEEEKVGIPVSKEEGKPVIVQLDNKERIRELSLLNESLNDKKFFNEWVNRNKWAYQDLNIEKYVKILSQDAKAEKTKQAKQQAVKQVRERIAALIKYYQ